ncbi:PLP-dependent aminotransferase family protein [Affinibrenneria salicis]|uniref:PLP-dependent aminotransferase family protein n=1 Tax=Affinibrenneria salicis TaxID=2590031 RepID=A0A5J5FSJ7_9GAMM|nr:PLP-dependent aminotransferase family protein [Affinibrenneria salicis]KAA8995641.1 PLP-dependent aminotransferase family protein [Affinibrenneria salicis]
MAEQTSRYRRIAEQLKQSILEGTLPAGSKLPSVRKLATQYGSSMTTTLKALRTLEDERYAQARPKSGFYAALPEQAPAAPLQPVTIAPLDQQTELHLAMLGSDCRVRLDLANGAGSLYPIRKIGLLMRQLSYRQPQLLGNAIKGGGYPPLQAEIARRAVDYGCSLKAEEIIVTNGCIEALSLALRAVTRPGDSVAVDSPCYFVLLQMLSNLGLKVVEVGRDEQGCTDAQQLATLFSQRVVTAWVALANVNNPVGTTMTDENKAALTRLADQYGVTIIEDDTFGDTAFGAARPFPLRAFSSQVILCSGFSKTIAPGLRIGWLSGGQWSRKIAALKYTSTMGTSILPQAAVAELLKNGGYDAHLRQLRRELARQIVRLRAAVLRHFPAGTRVSAPQGGYVLWVEMPANCLPSHELFRLAREHGIGIAPGHLFSTDRRFDHCLRLNAGFGWSEEVDRALRSLAQWSRLPAGEE